MGQSFFIVDKENTSLPLRQGFLSPFLAGGRLSDAGR
jgi:hypothetical protein